MTSTPTPPVVPLPDDEGDDTTLLGEDERPLDTDLDDDAVDSAEADRRAATEGEIGEDA
ncbi:hypothetical protein [Actinotalea caeni]|uniref:hypothetical protein n=1 Tax=Actinotalea caeni TaxID=1348467 RepID=UPI00147852D0|nr:hypothetical protein [Actinotalea caeni]